MHLSIAGANLFHLLARRVTLSEHLAAGVISLVDVCLVLVLAEDRDEFVGRAVL